MAQTSWFTWQVPEARLNQYLFYMVMVVFVVPYIAGIMFTSLGYFLNVDADCLKSTSHKATMFSSLQACKFPDPIPYFLTPTPAILSLSLGAL